MGSLGCKSNGELLKVSEQNVTCFDLRSKLALTAVCVEGRGCPHRPGGIPSEGYGSWWGSAHGGGGGGETWVD